jgi:hypothetical protein
MDTVTRPAERVTTSSAQTTTTAAQDAEHRSLSVEEFRRYILLTLPDTPAHFGPLPRAAATTPCSFSSRSPIDSRSTC